MKGERTPVLLKDTIDNASESDSKPRICVHTCTHKPIINNQIITTYFEKKYKYTTVCLNNCTIYYTEPPKY